MRARSRDDQAALSTIGVDPNTMHLYRIHASTALIEQAWTRDDLRVVVESLSIEFVDGGFGTDAGNE